MSYSKINNIQTTALILVIMLNHLILNLPKNLLDSCGPSAPLNVIYVSILMFIFLFIVLKLFKNFSNSDILDVAEFLGGKILKTIIGLLFVAYFVTISATQLRNFCEILQLTYFPYISISLLIIFFLIIAVIANKFGDASITRINLIVVPLVMINLLVAFFCISPRFVPERIFPILGYGFNETFFSGISNIFAFTGLSYIYFLQPLLRDTKKYEKLSFIGMGISALYLLLSVTALLFSFADVLYINELSPIYLLIRGANWGRFIQRPDAIFFLGWILCMMSYISITIMFITLIFKKIGNLSTKNILAYPASALIFIVAMLPKGMVEIRFIENYIFKYFTIGLVFIVSFIVLALANIKYENKTSKKEI